MKKTSRRGRPPGVRGELKFTVKLRGRLAKKFSKACVKQGRTQSALAAEAIGVWLVALELKAEMEREEE